MDMLAVNQFECIREAVSVLGAFINIELSYECIPEIEHAYGQLRRDRAVYMSLPCLRKFQPGWLPKFLHISVLAEWFPIRDWYIKYSKS